MKITQADAPTIRMDCHPIQTNWCPRLCHLHHFYAGCPSWHNPPNLSWLGTGTKYPGLHTRWLTLYSVQTKLGRLRRGGICDISLVTLLASVCSVRMMCCGTAAAVIIVPVIIILIIIIILVIAAVWAYRR